MVFIGVVDPSVEDGFTTPFSGTVPMAGVEFHAGAADTILSGSFIKGPPVYQRLLLVVVLGLAAIALGRFPRSLFGCIGAVALVGLLVGAWLAAFSAAGYFWPIAAPLAMLLVGYGVALTDRTSVELWEKQQARSMLSRYLPPDMVTEVLKNPVAARLGGRRVEMSILFSDIRGFTSLSEGLAPEAVVDLLNEYLSVMTEIIFRNGGTIDKFEGDAILAFFGAPQPLEDHPERAVLTAIEMREGSERLQDQWLEVTKRELAIGVGVHSGEAMVGNVGSLRRMDYTVIGDSVNLASRLQDLTKDYGASILISGATQSRVEQMCRLRFLGSVEVRGRLEPVNLYEVVGLLTEADVPASVDLAPVTNE